MFGMKVKLDHVELGQFVMRNVTGVHYNYRRRLRSEFGREVMIAFESDVHGTARVFPTRNVLEFEAVLETEKAESF